MTRCLTLWIWYCDILKLQARGDCFLWTLSCVLLGSHLLLVHGLLESSFLCWVLRPEERVGRTLSLLSPESGGRAALPLSPQLPLTPSYLLTRSLQSLTSATPRNPSKVVHHLVITSSHTIYPLAHQKYWNCVKSFISVLKKKKRKTTNTMNILKSGMLTTLTKVCAFETHRSAALR